MSPYTKQKSVLRLPAEADADGPGLHLQSLGHRERRERHPLCRAASVKGSPGLRHPVHLAKS